MKKLLFVLMGVALGFSLGFSRNTIETTQTPEGFSAKADYVEVADLAALCAMRETFVKNQKYLVKGEVVVTAIIGKFGSNQTTTNAWVQDKNCETSKGHSMMLYYVNDVLKDAKVGDVVTGLMGELTVYQDLIEMQNFDGSQLQINGTADITVDDVTIAELSGTDKWLYQNAIVRVKNAEFADAGKTFEVNKTYNITDATGTVGIYTNREGSYLKQTIPSGKLDVTAYVGYHNGAQLCIRTAEDVGLESGDEPGDDDEPGDEPGDDDTPLTEKTDLMISEYLEGSSNNKALELYNGTGNDIDLSAYRLVKEVNGDASKATEIKLEGTLKAGATYVIANSSSNCAQAIRDLANLTESNNVMNFNGNDAVILYKGDTKIDVVGVEGSEADWGKDVTLRRKCDKGPNTTYDPSEWTQAAKDDYSNLGKYCSEDLSAPSISKIVTKATVNTSIDVYFTQEVEKASAETAANYSIEGLTISSAVLDNSGRMVTLTTSAMTGGAEYTLVVNGVKGVNENVMENVSVKFTFGYAEVADLAALCAMRETYAEGQKYLVKGEVVVTAIIGKFGSNQTTTNAWVQDKDCETSKGHSMMLYYVNDIFEGVKVGDVITGIVGELTVYSDLIEMQNLGSSTIEVTGTADITVDDVTIADLNGADKWLYQNAIVRIKNAQYADAGKTFAENTNYSIRDDNNGIMPLRTNREGDYLGQTIPSGKVTVSGYVGYYSGNVQLCVRTKEDCGIGVPSAIEDLANINFSVYPNPTNGIMNVELNDGGLFDLFVYNVNGMQLLRHEGLMNNARVDLSALAKGMYVVEIRTAEGVVRTKVVVR